MKKEMMGMRKGVAAVLAVVISMSPMMDMTTLAAKDRNASEIKRVWDFSDGEQGWGYDNSWAGDSYTGDGACGWDEEKQMLKVSLDYSGNKNNGWSQTGISFTESAGIDYSDYKVLSFDLYYDTSAFTSGEITVKAYSDNIFQEQTRNVNQAPVVDAGENLKMVTLSMLCDTSRTKTEKPQTLMLLLVGNNTDYKGDIWLDSITLSNIKVEKYLVDSTVRVETKTSLTGTDKELTVNGESYPYVDSAKLVDPDADPSVIGLYQYLKVVGESEATLYGHMEDTVLKAGSSELTYSDTADVTGSYSAIVGLDAGNLFSGFADKYNGRHPEANLPDTNEGNIEAAALLSNESISDGAIITISAHAPNFSASTKIEGTFDHPYDRFDYTVSDSYMLTGNTMNEILPGGLYHEAFQAYLDMLADYADQVQGPILFRPFHENTGSWFWWGKAFCSAETYKSVFKYTVEYLRDERGVHNLLYVYGPGAEAGSPEEYEERYPGDEYVDIIGFDIYDVDPVPDEEGYTFQQNFDNLVKLTDNFAKEHDKLFAVTETGISSSSGGALTETGNRRPEWYKEILDIVTKPEYDCCYFMLWANYSRTGSYYTPFVEEINEDSTLFGHELLDPFIRFYNNEKSIFAKDQLEMIKAINQGELELPKLKTWDQISGYIINPISGSRVLEEMTLQARVNQKGANVEFRVGLKGQEVSIPATTTGKRAEAKLDTETLKNIGQVADGRVSLYSGGMKLQETSVLFNIEPRPDDPFLVDDFESYAGIDNLLTESWAINKDSGCELNLALSREYSFDGNYSMKFEYKETKNGWAGCVLSKEADWSECNALQFMVVPDGNNQRTVVQINTDGGSYEAWLQEYPEYVESKEPLLITLPFNEFKDRNAGVTFSKDLASTVSSVGFWVNAIPDSAAIDSEGMVHGVLYYDAVRARYEEELEPVFEVLDPSVKPEVTEGTAVDGSVVEKNKMSVVLVLSGAVVVLSFIGLMVFTLKGKKKGN